MAKTTMGKKLAAVIAALGLAGGTVSPSMAFAAERDGEEALIATQSEELDEDDEDEEDPEDEEWDDTEEDDEEEEDDSEDEDSEEDDPDDESEDKGSREWEPLEAPVVLSNGWTIERNGRLVIPDGTQGYEIGFMKLREYRDLVRYLYIPGSVETIPAGAFMDSWNLQKVVIGEGVKVIDGSFFGFGAFQDCPNLVRVSIPSSMETIHCKAFMKTGLTYYEYVKGLTVEQIDTLSSQGGSLDPNGERDKQPAFSIHEHTPDPNFVWELPEEEVPDSKPDPKPASSTASQDPDDDDEDDEDDTEEEEDGSEDEDSEEDELDDEEDPATSPTVETATEEKIHATEPEEIGEEETPQAELPETEDGSPIVPLAGTAIAAALAMAISRRNVEIYRR